MRLRNSRVRTKITALLLSLVALWVFAAWVTLREGVNLLWVNQLDKGISQPGDLLIVDLQKERRLSIVLARGGATAANVEALKAQRAQTDKTRSQYRELADGRLTRMAAGTTLERRIDASFGKLTELDRARAWFDSPVPRQSPDWAQSVYTETIGSLYRVYDSMATLDDESFAADVRVLVSLARAKELFSQEDAFVSGVLADGRFTVQTHTQYLKLLGAQRQAMTAGLLELKDSDVKAYNEITTNSSLTLVQSLEERLSALPNRKPAPPQVSLTEWQNASGTLLSGEQDLLWDAGDRLVEDAKPIAAMVVVRLVLAGGLGFLAVVASVVLSVTTARHLVQQLERLRDSANDLADVRLPSVVERLGAGEQLDVKTEAPPLEFGDDDIGKVGQAFNSVQEQAIRTAVEQAELRRGIRDILLSLARRSQALVHRQLTLLDAMERREIDTEELEDLFRVDHLATRMRRNAENLIILSGATPARGWRKPVPMVDVVRSAVAEVEDYTRVTVLPVGEVNLVGRAVADIAHLLAELIENAVSFSPPYTVAQISGHLVASGYAVEIEDRGLGMSDENLDLINRRIENPPEFNLSSSVQLGLYVVGKLAERYGVQVTLKRSPYGGTTAVVVIPRDLIEEGEGDKPSQPLTAVASVMSEPVHTENGGALGTGATPLAAPVAVQRTGPTAVPAVVEAEETTPAGLPVRVPQASLAAPLREEPGEAEPVEEDPGRSPEEIRRIVGAFQIGAKRGRAASAESSESESE